MAQGIVAASDDGYVRFYTRDLTKVYWERRVDSSVYASLVVDAARGHVIVAATSGMVVCFDLRGRTVWSADTGSPVFATPAVSPDAGLLAISAFHSRFVGLDLATGALVIDRRLPEPWHARHGGSASYRDPYASPVITEFGDVIIGCAEHVLCLAPDGEQRWQYTIGRSIRASPAAIHETGEVAVCAVDGTCTFLDSRSGRERATLRLGSKVTASPAVSGQILAIGTQDDVTTGVDVRTHEIRWRSSQGGPRSYTSFSVLPGGDFIATTGRGNVLCLRRDDGLFLWETSQVLGLPDHDPTLDITPMASPQGYLYCASYSGYLYCFGFAPVEEAA